jgi:hypothetical protein
MDLQKLSRAFIFRIPARFRDIPQAHGILARGTISHHPMIRTQLPSLIITPGVGQLGVLSGDLHILMAQPVLYEAEFTAGVEEGLAIKCLRLWNCRF